VLNRVITSMLILVLTAACAESEKSPDTDSSAVQTVPAAASVTGVSSIDYCMPLPPVGGIELFAEDNLLATDAVNAYLRKARVTATVAARICSVTTDFGRIFTAYDELYGRASGSGMGEGVSIRASGTMAQSPEGCWLLFLDGGAGAYQLEPLPRLLMRTGQRAELLLSGRPVYSDLSDCPFPTLSAAEVESSDWQNRPGALAEAFAPAIRSALQDLGFASTVTVDGTVVRVPALTTAQSLALQRSLQGRYGMFMRVGTAGSTTIWPDAGTVLN
jgi:hypothetical protein